MTNSVSLWDTSAQESADYPTLAGDQRTDIAIVGGGYTGLSTALHAAERGLECLVLEAEQIGYGGSGRNGGLVNAGLWLPPQDVRQRLGGNYGARLVDVLSAAPEYVHTLIERHQIRCEPTRTGTIHAAHSQRGFEDLARRAEEWKRLGAPVDLLSREQAAEKIGSNAFFGGLLDHRAGTINPMGYVRGLARSAQAAGATINVGTRARALRRERNRWIIETDRGIVTADRVVLGTNAYTDGLWPGLKGTFTLIHYFQLATAPLAKRGEAVLRERQALWNTHPIMFSLRRDAFGRIIIGSMGKAIGGNRGLSQRWALRNLSRLYPDLGALEIETSWHGRIAMTPDHLPRIHRLADGLYTPIGYNGRGITSGTIFGRAMAQLLAGGREEDLPLPITEPKRVASAPTMSRLYQAAFTANQVLKSL